MESVCAESTCSHPASCTDLHRGDYIILQERPCKIVDVTVCKTGKHGHAKYHFTGLDIFDLTKHEGIYMGDKSVTVPEVKRETMTLIKMVI
jgi:translation elongation factor IF5A